MLGRREQIGSHAALRGMAALCVVAYHLQFGRSTHLAIEDATFFFRRGYLLVDLFFILSGFILSYVNRGDRGTPFGAAEYRDFLGRRLIRLYPLLIFSLLAMLALAATLSALSRTFGIPVRPDWSGTNLLVLISQVLLLNAWTTLPPGWNIPSWSISAEVFAYLLFPLIVSFHAMKPRLATALLMTIALAFYAYAAMGPASLDIVRFPAPLRCLAGFAIGMLIYYARNPVAALPSGAIAALQTLSLGGALVCLMLPINDVLIVPAFAILVATTWTDRGPVPWLIARGPLIYLGDISYSVYLNHVLIIEALNIVWYPLARHFALSDTVDRLSWVTGCYAAILLASHLTHRLIEIPARRTLTRTLLGHPARPLGLSAPA